MKYYAIVDHYRIDKTEGEKRFSIKQIDYSPKVNLPYYIRYVDKSKRKLQESVELLLNCWERGKVPQKHFTPSKRPFLCVTGHSRGRLTTYYQPWWQIKKEVEARGLEFIG